MGLIPFMKKLIGRIVKTSKCQNPEILKLWVIVPCHNVSKRFIFLPARLCFTPILWFFKLQLSLLIILSTSMFYLSHIGLVLYLGQESRKKSQDGGEDGGVLEDALEGL